MSELEQVITDIEHVILSSGAHLRLIFSDVDDIKEDRRYSSGTCPFCQQRAKFRISNEGPFSSCWRSGCQWGDGWHNWHEYIQARGRAISWIDFYQELAREAGIEWPEPSEQAKKAYESQAKRASLLEAAYELCKQALWQPSGAAVLSYLRGRGYSDEAIKEMELGAYAGQQALSQGLQAQGYSERDINEADIFGRKWETHPALLLWRDKAGRALGLMGRRIAEGIEPKYLYSKGMARSQALPGLERARKAEELIVTESPLAAAYLNAKGMSRPVVALGGTALSKGQIEAIQQAGAKRLILALDMDEPGQKATASRIEQLLKAAELERLLVASWQGEKALDDMALQKGLQAAEEAISQAERVGSWLAKHTAAKLPERPSDLEEESILEQAVEQYLWLAEGDMLQARAYVEALSAALGLHPQLLWPRLSKAEERLKQKRQEEQLRAIQLKAGQVSAETGPLAAARYLAEQTERLLRDSREAKLPEPYPLANVLQDIIQAPDALPTGLSSLEHKAYIPRAGLSIIAAESGVGKTTFMLNLLANWLEMESLRGQAFYFYSYEEPKAHIALKLIMIWAGVQLHEEQNYRAYINYLKSKRGQDKAIEAAISKYERLAAEGRLIIDDTMPMAEDLSATLSLLGKKGGVGAVIVDYIQRVPSLSQQATRQLELAHTAQLLREAAVSQEMAIITGSQLNEEGRLREARDIYHEAALVLKLLQDKETRELSLFVEKQRAGRAGISVPLSFERPILKISDRQAQPAPATNKGLSYGPSY